MLGLLRFDEILCSIAEWLGACGVAKARSSAEDHRNIRPPCLYFGWFWGLNVLPEGDYRMRCKSLFAGELTISFVDTSV